LSPPCPCPIIAPLMEAGGPKGHGEIRYRATAEPG
jgi:hypothetical protein